MKAFRLRRLLTIIHANVRRNLTSSSSAWAKQTHYDVLKVPKDSTKSEIRSAFIKLSKELHPDVNKQVKNDHKDFVKLNEAYSVLSKPEARRQYDLSLRGQEAAPSVYHQRDEPHMHNPWNDPSLFRNRDKSKDNKDGANSYYGIKNVKRVSNKWIAVILIAVAAVGTICQAVLIRYSVTFKRNALDDASAKYSAMHKVICNEANENGNVLQLERIKNRLSENDKW